MDPALLIAGGFGVFVMGIALLVIGLRGRRLSDHPSCRRCGYDLWGLRRPQMCPECGSDLVRRRAMLRGVRQRRPIVIATGALIIFMSLAGGGIVGYQQSRGFDWNTIKPVWLLVYEASREGGSNVDGALDELLARQGRGDLSDGQVAVIVARGLHIQGDLSRTWNYRWGDLILRAHGAGLVAHEDYVRFARQAIGAELRVRPEIVEGEPVVAALLAMFRSGSTTTLALHAFDVQWMLDDQPVAAASRSEARTLISLDFVARLHQGLGMASFRADFPQPFHHDPLDPFCYRLPSPPVPDAGTSEVAVSFRVYISDAQSGMLLDETLVVRKEIKALPRGSDTVTLVREESLKEKMRQALSVVIAARLTIARQVAPNTVLMDQELPNFLVSAFFAYSEILADFAFDVYARSGDEEWPLGQITSDPWMTSPDPMFPAPPRYSVSRAGASIARHIVGFHGEKVDIILRSSPAAARRTFGLTRIWDGEIIFEDVPVDWGRRGVDLPMTIAE